VCDEILFACHLLFPSFQLDPPWLLQSSFFFLLKRTKLI
jgi:hypothetical protein